MNEYLGKTCPFCKTDFVQGDDIVLCSACDMPHHKACWVENQGCTTFGCTGTIRSVGGTLNSVTADEFVFEETPSAVFCVRCGTQNVGNRFCVSCGSKLPELNRSVPQTPPPAYPQSVYQPQQPAYQPQQQPAYQPQQPAYQQPTYQQPAYQQPAYQQPAYQQPAYQQPAYQQPRNTYHPGGFTARQPNVDPDVLTLVGTGIPYYTTAFEKLKTSGGKISWNWAAFIESGCWFIYRKMYLYGGIVLAAYLLLILLDIPFLVLALAVASGLLGNWLYMTHLEKLADQAKRMQEPQRSNFLRSSGDVNLLAAILSAGGYALLAVLL